MEINITKINLNPNAGGGGKPIELQEKSITITENGTREITPDADFGGMSMVKVTVSSPDAGKKLLPIGISLSGSTWETFDMNDYNFSYNTKASYLFQNCKNLTELTMSPIKPLSCEWFLTNCTSLQTVNGLEKIDTSEVTNMNNMFGHCQNLKSLDLSNWNTSKVTNMSYMFNGCHKLSEIKGIESWDTSKITTMNNMFDTCLNLISLDLSNWNTSKVTNMSYMFNGCQNLISLDVSGWDVTKIPNTMKMFRDCQNLKSLDLSTWDLSKVTNMESMFENCKSLEEIRMGGQITMTYAPSIFSGVKDGGTFYYPKEYDYTAFITNYLPSSWTAVAY